MFPYMEPKAPGLYTVGKSWGLLNALLYLTKHSQQKSSRKYIGIFSDLDFSGRQVIVNSLYIKSHMSANEGECC